MNKPKTYVIEEDEHLQNLGKIIQRDFFPNRIKEENDSEAIPLSINDYLKHFKSDENQVFTELVQTDIQQWKKKHQWMEKGKKLLMLQSENTDKPFTNMIKRDPVLKQIQFGNTKQEALNTIFFSSDKPTVSFNSIEHDKAKKVYYDNTRIEAEEIQRNKMYERRLVRDFNVQEIPQTPILSGRKQDLGVQGEYSLKRIPSPQPQKVPIMTWGEIESTPLRLSQPIEYRIPETSARDKLLDDLTARITKQKKIKKKEKEDLKSRILSSVRMQNSSYRKVSTVREKSQKRQATFAKVGSQVKKQAKA